jgi:hypothetical protein
MTVQTSAGSSLSIATGLPVTYDGAGYAALVYTIIGEVTDIGEFGRMHALVTHIPVATRRVQKFKGSYNNGSVVVQMGRDQANAGQTAAKAAVLSDASYSFKVVLQDLTKIYFTGKVMDYKSHVGTVDIITGASMTIEIDSDVVEV